MLPCLFPGKIRRYRLVSRYTRLPEKALVHNVHQSVSEVSTCKCLSGFSITTANLTPIQPASGQAFDEWFLRKRPADSHRREICPTVSLTKRRTTVTTECKLQQITLFVIISQTAEITHHPLLGKIRRVIARCSIVRKLRCSVIHHRRDLLRVIIVHIIAHSPQPIAVHRKCLFLVCIDTHKYINIMHIIHTCVIMQQLLRRKHHLSTDISFRLTFVMIFVKHTGSILIQVRLRVVDIP